MGTQSGWQEWVGEDFVDNVTHLPAEPDPWEPSKPPIQIREDHGVPQSDLRATAHDLTDQSDPYVLVDDEPGVYMPESEWSDSSVEISSDWDEPEPMVDAASDLSESLYPPDNSITDVSLDLKIGELLLQVEPIDEEQRVHCLGLLKEYGLGRLRRLLPWLCDRTWHGAQLRLFLEFRKHWESKANAHWWEAFLWTEREQRWMPAYQRGTLTLHHSRALVHWRSQCEAIDVIDNEWFWDWESFAPWELGVRSFADFALFRAGIPAENDWRKYLVRQDERTGFEIAQCLDPTFAPFMLPSFTEQYGLPPMLYTETHPWPRASELAHKRANEIGGDLACAWYDILSGSMDV